MKKIILPILLGLDRGAFPRSGKIGHGPGPREIHPGRCSRVVRESVWERNGSHAARLHRVRRLVLPGH